MREEQHGAHRLRHGRSRIREEHRCWFSSADIAGGARVSEEETPVIRGPCSDTRTVEVATSQTLGGSPIDRTRVRHVDDLSSADVRD